MLSRKIDKILIADSEAQSLLLWQGVVQALAPHADIQIATDRETTFDLLVNWLPVLAVIRIPLAFDNRLSDVGFPAFSRLPMPPFLIGIGSETDTPGIIRAMQFGFNHVTPDSADRATIQGAICTTVAAVSPMTAQLNRLIAPRLYSDDQSFDLKQLNSAVEQHVFQLATRITGSKNGISKLLGISRQLVQYHMKKMGG